MKVFKNGSGDLKAIKAMKLIPLRYDGHPHGGDGFGGYGLWGVGGFGFFRDAWHGGLCLAITR